MKFELTVGADPEFFLYRNGQPISAHDLVPGDKKNPHKLKRGAVQLDGTAVEFNIDPAKTASQFCDNINETLEEIREIVPKKYEFKFVPSVIYEPNYFKKIPIVYKNLGCDPDFSAKKHGAMNPPPDGNVGTMRTGAGHIHVGWATDKQIADPDHIWDCCQLTDALDGVLYCSSELWDKDKRRQQMYGKPGAFRPKSYGVEYRVLSNAWLNFPKLWPWLFDAVQAVFEHMVEGQRAYGPGWGHGYSLSELNHYYLQKQKLPLIPNFRGA